MQKVINALTFPLAAAAAAVSDCYNPVTLDGYGTFSGTTINSTYSGEDLPVTVDAWLGMDYATQPIGDKRFSPVEFPASFDGVKKATEFGKACVQAITTSLPEDVQDEACLNFNVYRTPGIPLDQKLPVLVWIHGGAFYSGSYKSFDGAAFAASSKEPVVVVNFHYRVNSLGFLPSALFDEEGLSNLGIRDQRLFLEFVQQHIGAFGGDADAVTIGGRSAGGHSVGIHYFHNYGEDEGRKPPFAAAIHQSGAVTSRAFPNATYPLYVRQYEEYTEYLGCDSGEDNAAATLACLREADIADIRNISTKIFEDYDPAITWPFQPVQGGTLFEKSGARSGVDGTFFHVPTISSTTTDEGKFYVPGDLETNEEFLDFLHNISPELTPEDLHLIESLYPDPASAAASAAGDAHADDNPYANSPNSTQYNRLAAAWSDYAYICPGQETSSRTSSRGVPTWKLRFNTPNRVPDWQGIPHTSDTQYTWDEPTAEFPEISHVYHGYLSSFVTAGDPNAHRFPGSPEWPRYEAAGYGGETGAAGKQLVVQPGGTGVEEDDIRREACLFWRDPERAGRLNK